jgi:hypothetical protein
LSLASQLIETPRALPLAGIIPLSLEGGYWWLGEGCNSGPFAKRLSRRVACIAYLTPEASHSL